MDQCFHELDWVRLRIAQAHAVHVMPRRSDGQAAEYTIPASHMRKNKPSNEAEDVCGGLSIVKGREKRRSSSSLPLPPWAFDDSRIVKAVNRLPDNERRWVRYAYTADYSWDDESGAVADLWAASAPQLTGLRPSSLQKVRGMTYLCIQDYKSIRTSGKPAHKPERIRQLLAIPEGNWRRDWLPRWKLLQAELKAIDSSALAKILEVASDRQLVN